MNRSMMTLLPAAVLLAGAVLLPAQEIKIAIDEKLTGWTKAVRSGFDPDTEVKVSEPGSIRLTAEDPARPRSGWTLVNLDPNRKYEVTFMAKGENITDNRTGLFSNFDKLWDRLARLEGTFDWKKVSGVLDPKRVGSKGQIKLHVSLFGKTGKLWVDRITIVPLTAGQAAAQKVPAQPKPQAGTVPSADGNWYKNPKYETARNAAGALQILHHAVTGKFTPAEPHDGHPAIRVESAFLKSWGAVVGIVWQLTFPTMKPGRYTFSVKCCTESETIQKLGLYASRVPAGETKNVSIFRKYDVSELPKPGKWVELAINFEVKPGDTKLNFFYCFWSPKPATVLFSDPRIDRAED